MIPPLRVVFEQLTDYRHQPSRIHPLGQTLTLIFLAVLSGETSLRGVAAWLGEQRWRLKHPFRLRNGRVPSYGTIRRALLGVDVNELEQALSRWGQTVMQQEHPDHAWHLAMDGKTLRGSGSDKTPALHVLSVFCEQLGMVLAQQAVGHKTNEIPVARQLLHQLTLDGCVITADALHTQRTTAEQIVEKGGTICWS